MTDRKIIQAYSTYIAELRSNVPLYEDEASVVFQAVSCEAEELVKFFLLSYGETLESYLTNG